MPLALMNQDFSELLRAFNDHNVDYLVVGAHALAAHGHVRATKDLDVGFGQRSIMLTASCSL